MNDLPKEVTYTPVPYIGLVGLDPSKNSIHAAIWNTLAINRTSERLPLYYKLIADNYEFAAFKSKKQGDKMNVEGILKTNWLSKHLFHIPSVVVIFEKIDSNLLKKDDNLWRNFMARLTAVSISLQSRQTKIVVVFLQSNADVLTDDLYKDVNAKLSAEGVDYVAKCLIIPIHEQNLISQYVIRIENVLFDLSKLYYTNQVKIIKTQKDSFNKSMQLYLYIRLEFKLGFYNEIRQIYPAALTHYKNAYASLMEIQTTPANIYEVKNVASLLNYKICRLSFYLNNPMDAFSQFKKHTEIYQNMVGPKAIEFEHCSWLGSQYQMFGESFEMAVNVLGLAPKPNLHPGIYFFQAAGHFANKRRAASEHKHLLDSVPPEEKSRLNQYLDTKTRIFVGQFPWRGAGDSAGGDGSPTPNDEVGFKALQLKELTFDNTKLLVSLYNNVLNYLKRFKKSRFTKFVMYLIGREYYLVESHVEALSYLGSIISFYREEKWPTLYHSILDVAHKASYYSVDYGNFIKFGLEMMVDETRPLNHRINIIKSILSLLNLKFKPLQLLSYDDEKRNQALEERWQTCLAKLEQSEGGGANEIPINMDKGLLFLEFKIAFGAACYQVDEMVDIEVVVLSHLPVDVELAGYQLKFHNAHYDQFCNVNNNNNNNNNTQLILKSDQMNRFRFAIKPVFEDIGKMLLASEFVLRLETKVPVLFHWSCHKQDEMTPSFFYSQDEMYAFHKFGQRIETKILNHRSLLEVAANMDTRIFLNQIAPLCLSLKSNELVAISKLELSAKQISNETNEVIEPQFECFVSGKTSEDVGLTKVTERATLLDKLTPGEGAEVVIFLKVTTLGKKKFCLNLTYDLQLGGGGGGDNENAAALPTAILVAKQFVVEVECIEPFTFSAAMINLGGGEAVSIRANEPFDLCLLLKPTIDSSIRIDSVDIQLADNIGLVSGEVVATTTDDQVLSGEHRRQYRVCASIETIQPYRLGTYTVRWRKNIDDHSDNNKANVRKDLLTTETSVSLPSVVIKSAPVFVELSKPPACVLRTPFMATYRIHNRLAHEVVLEVCIGPSDSFMVSGNKLIKLTLAGKSWCEQTYIMLPVTRGDIVLPHLGITLLAPKQSSPLVVDYINQMIPSLVHVSSL